MKVIVVYRSGQEQEFIVDQEILVCDFLLLVAKADDKVKTWRFP